MSPGLGTVIPGNGLTVTVQLVGSHFSIDLSCATPPVAGLACSMNPTSGVPRRIEDRHDTGTTSTLTITTQPSTPAGSYPITVTGKMGSAIHQVSFLLRVEPGDNFNRPNGSALGANWNEILPNLELFNSQIRNTDAGSKAAIFNGPIGPDQDVSVNCKAPPAEMDAG